MKVIFDIRIPLEGDMNTIFAMCDHIEENILHSERESSGAGFGYRDMQIPVEGTEKDINNKEDAIIEYLKSNGIAIGEEDGGAHVSYYDDDDVELLEAEEAKELKESTCPKCGGTNYVNKLADDETYRQCNDCKYYSGE